MAYDHDKWRAYEDRRAEEVEQELTAALESGNTDQFKQIYRDRALRYLTKKRRNPLYRRFLQIRLEGKI